MEKDLIEGWKWREDSAEGRLDEAQVGMGRLYENGYGYLAPKNPDKAAEWYKLAADQGHEEAIAALKRLDEEHSPPVDEPDSGGQVEETPGPDQNKPD